MKKSIKKLTGIAAASMLAVGLLAGCGGSSSGTETQAAAETEAAGTTAAAAAETAAPAEDAITLVYAEVNSLDSLDGKIATFFKDKVAEKSGGSVIIDIQASGVLGAEADVLDGMTNNSGTVDLCRISCFALNSYGAKLSSLLSVPFTFEDRDHFWAFTETALAQQVLAEPQELGLGTHGL